MSRQRPELAASKLSPSSSGRLAGARQSVCRQLATVWCLPIGSNSHRRWQRYLTGVICWRFFGVKARVSNQDDIHFELMVQHCVGNQPGPVTRSQVLQVGFASLCVVWYARCADGK